VIEKGKILNIYEYENVLVEKINQKMHLMEQSFGTRAKIAARHFRTLLPHT
jgi:hypothetical protein